MASKSRDISMLCKKGGELPENGKWSLSRVACEVPQIVESDIEITKKKSENEAYFEKAKI